MRRSGAEKCHLLPRETIREKEGEKKNPNGLKKELLTAPKMTLALGSASDDTTCDTSFTSASVMSLPPVMLYTTPVARSMERSIRGADVAASAASRARPFPLATPTPSMAVPESRMMALTSAKSTLTCLEKGREKKREQREKDEFLFFLLFFPTSRDLDTRKRTETKERKEEKRISRTHQPRDGDDVRDALHALAQDVVREQERVRERGRVPDDAEEASVLKNIPRSFFCSRSVFRRSLFSTMGWSSLDSLLPRFLSRTGKISFLYESEPKKRGRARKRAPSKTSFLPVVGDDDQGVDRLAERLDAVCGGAAAAAALEGEGVGDDADLLTVLLFFWVRRKRGKGRERRIREESRRGVVAFSVFSWRVRVRPSRRWEQERGFPSPPPSPL